ncbi:hypothetical protein BKA60DRAFT_614104 [Fusarium oxysporum]|nr:hypothetical protein BKA60DRAFT_614104 [Fusarium oxysporum]
MESQRWDCCRNCFRHLDKEPKWRALQSYKIFCDECATKKLQGKPKMKQMDWAKCMICFDPFPNCYFTCREDPKTRILQGHALCGQCIHHLRRDRCNWEKGFVKICPKCKARPTMPVRVVASTVIELPEDEPAVIVDRSAVLVSEPAVPVDGLVALHVVNVRLGRSLNDMQVKVRWEDTWERASLMDVDRLTRVKSIVECTPEAFKVRWKDTWVSFESLEDGLLKEEARRLLEDNYSV